jgi:hypothetical protein
MNIYEVDWRIRPRANGRVQNVVLTTYCLNGSDLLMAASLGFEPRKRPGPDAVYREIALPRETARSFMWLPREDSNSVKGFASRGRSLK